MLIHKNVGCRKGGLKVREKCSDEKNPKKKRHSIGHLWIFGGERVATALSPGRPRFAPEKGKLPYRGGGILGGGVFKPKVMDAGRTRCLGWAVLKKNRYVNWGKRGTHPSWRGIAYSGGLDREKNLWGKYGTELFFG